MCVCIGLFDSDAPYKLKSQPSLFHLPQISIYGPTSLILIDRALRRVLRIGGYVSNQPDNYWVQKANENTAFLAWLFERVRPYLHKWKPEYLETTGVEVSAFPRPFEIRKNSLMAETSGCFFTPVQYLGGLPEREKIDVMRLKPNRPVASLTWPRAYRTEVGCPYDAPAGAERIERVADSTLAGWTEMVIQGDQKDSLVFLIAGTSRERAPEDRRRSRLDQSDKVLGISHQAIKR